MKMWAVLGEHKGLHGLFHSKWKAKEAADIFWNLDKKRIICVNVKKVNETLYEVRSFKYIREDK